MDESRRPKASNRRRTDNIFMPCLVMVGVARIREVTASLVIMMRFFPVILFSNDTYQASDFTVCPKGTPKVLIRISDTCLLKEKRS